MFKNFQPKKTTRHRISSPVLVETTLDETAYKQMSDAGFPEDLNVEWNPQNLRTRRPLPPPPPRPNFESLGLNAIPKTTAFRPASSVYSQPSPRSPRQRFPRKPVYADNNEISPPSSPDMELDRHMGRFRSHGEEAVSPIDETEEQEQTFDTMQYQKERAAARNIPVMRREKRRNEGVVNNANMQARRVPSESTGGAIDGRNGLRKASAAPKYDPYTGEPTMDEKGRPQQVKPSAYHGKERPVTIDSGDRMGTRTSVTAGVPKPQTTFADRLRKLRERTVVAEEDVLPAPRPPWKGGSGRQTLVEPPTQPAKTRAFSAPIKKANNRRETAPEPDRYGKLGMHIDYTPSVETIIVPPTDMHPALRDRGQKYGRREYDNEDDEDEDEPSFTESPSSYNVSSPIGPLVLLPQQYLSAAEYDELHPEEARKKREAAAKRLPRTPDTASDLHDISVGVVERNFREALRESNLSPSTTNFADGQLPSKFSVTTYEPTPRPSTSSSNPYSSSPAPPLPEAPLNSIVNRRRPRINSIDTTKSAVPARKPVPGSPATTVMTSTTSINSQKPLPATPSEIAARSQDLCVVLQAQLDNLTRRRQNLEKSIYQMTQLMPQDGLLGGIGGALVGGGQARSHVVGSVRRGRSVMAEKFTEKRREEEKLKVEELKEQLADVRIQEHEVGLRLHRAWKRRDEGAVYEPTTLWVRRITG